MMRKSYVTEDKTNKIWKTGAYIRLSKEDGADESLSVTNQRKIILDYLSCNFSGEYAFKDFYIDDGESGTDYERPGFMRLLEDIKNGQINCVICKNLARAFRNYSDQGYFLENFFPLYNVRFITVGDPPVDTYLNPEATQSLEIPITGIMNDRYALKTSNDVRRTFDTKRRAGEFIGSFAPYGYKKREDNKNALEIDEISAKTVRLIFEMFVYENMSRLAIARRLNEMSIPNPTLYKSMCGLKYRNPGYEKNDGLWNGNTVSRILKNPVYTGIMVQGRQKVVNYKVHKTVSVPKEMWYIVPETHEKIIDNELFEIAQSKMKNNIKSQNGKTVPHIFSGVLKCARCGKAMTRKTAKGYAYYVCSTYARKSKDKCYSHTIREDKLISTVLHTLNDLISKYTDVRTVKEKLEYLHKKPKKESDPTEEKEKIKSLMKKYNNLLADAYIDMKSGLLSTEQYEAVLSKIKNKCDALLKIKDTCEKESSGSIKEETKGQEYFLKTGNIPLINAATVSHFIDQIDVIDGKNIKIYFKFNIS